MSHSAVLMWPCAIIFAIGVQRNSRHGDPCCAGDARSSDVPPDSPVLDMAQWSENYNNCDNAKFFPMRQFRMALSKLHVGIFDETCFSNDRAGNGFRLACASSWAAELAKPLTLDQLNNKMAKR